jgi:hypothetical protein
MRRLQPARGFCLYSRRAVQICPVVCYPQTTGILLALVRGGGAGATPGGKNGPLAAPQSASETAM